MKKNKSKLFITFLFVFFCLSNKVLAETKYIVLNDAVNIRKGPATTYGVYKTAQVGATYNLKKGDIIPDEANNNACNSGWYEIDYNGESGYICSEYVSLYTINDNETGVASTECEKEMEAAGFPSSYWGGLCSLKEAHPNWSFKSIQTNLDFTTAVNKFTNCSDSLVSNPKSEWIDTTCSYSEGSFKPVNQTAVAYYLDPRNFFTEKYIFQFEDNRYNSSLDTNYPVISKNIINNADFYKYHLGLGNDLPSLISTGGKETNVSPTHLASRMYQELGTGTRLKNLYSGTFYGDISYAPINPSTGDHMYDFRGYYNFYNIGVTGACVNGGGGATYCGLNKAIAYGWNSVPTAVTGGGSFLTSNYIEQGQYTSYLERFNVVPTQSKYMYVHYYMANLGAPSSEAAIAYNSYKASDLLNDAYVFYIPVYSNMGATINNSGNGAVDENETTSSPSITPVSTLITSAGYKLSGENIGGVEPGTSADTIINNIKSVGGTATITNNEGKEITEGTIGTGFKVTVKNSSETKTYTIVVKGDTSGDGIINAKDLLQVQKSILGTYSLENAYKLAADTSGDGIINAQDLLQVQKSILGTYKISQ